MKTRSFFILGGDLRNGKAADGFLREHMPVLTYGLEQADIAAPKARSLTLAAEQDVVVLPLPCSVDGETLNAPFADKPLPLDRVFAHLSPRQLITGGLLDEAVRRQAARFGLTVADYFDREELMVQNAVPTSEGALQIAMEEMPVTLHNSRVLCLGFGRTGKLLANSLAALGARVTVTARSYESLAWIAAYGYRPLPMGQLTSLAGYDAVFNTAPHPLLGEALLQTVGRDCVLIDLASKPGGVDWEAAKRLNVRVIWALSLPGKVAPVTAGEIIKNTVYHMAEEFYK